MLSFQVLTPEQIWSDCLTLAEKINTAGYTPELLVCIARGGLAVGRFLSDMLQVPTLRVFGVEFYKGINTREKKPKITQAFTEDITGTRVLVIDDVADTGTSLVFVKEHLERKKPASLKTATLHYKPQSILKPDFFIAETTAWLVYPWEYFEFSYTFLEEQLVKGEPLTKILAFLKQNGIPQAVLEKITREKTKEKERKIE